MNCYYSNLIEGHDTHPVDIERALKNDYSNDTRQRDLQLEAKAHIAVQEWIDGGDLRGHAATDDGIREIHRRFCERLPNDLLWVEDPKTKQKVRVVPSELRHRDVLVGTHIAVSPGAVADEVDSMLRREARADESRLLLVMARLYALIEALRRSGDNPRIEFAGVSRAVYVDVPEIELFGLGAYTWKTGSGYEGLTVLFWSNQSKEFLSWPAARPGAQKFDPRQRFYGEGPWDGTQSPQQVASSHLRLRNARRTASGRLSGSNKTSALVLAPTPLQTLDFADRLFTSWRALETYVRGKQPLGLRDPNPLELIVVLEPASFGTRKYDVISQSFAWDVYDRADELVVMSLPFREWSQDAIRVLETLEPKQNSGWRVVVRAALRDGALSIEPISILRPEVADRPVFQLAFDAAPAKSATGTRFDATATASDDDSEGEDTLLKDESVEPGYAHVSQSISELGRQLVSLAEMGCQNAERSNQEKFKKWHSDLSSLGLTLLAGAAIRLADPAGIAPCDVLRVRYLTYLHAQAIGQIA